MRGPNIIVRSISERRLADKHGNTWQYHSRSDHHSKVACWAILFDVLLRSATIRKHIKDGQIAFGINETLRDFRNNKEKDLDLVVCLPAKPSLGVPTDRLFSDLVDKYEIVLTAEEKSDLAALPPFFESSSASVRIALEAKACMTEFGKARPRLHDELTASYNTIHGAVEHAVAGGLVMINNSEEFLSPLRNGFDLSTHPAKVNKHKQPKSTLSVIEKVQQLPRRNKPGESGFDAIGIVVVECRNDGSPIELVSKPPALAPDANFSYEQLINRICSAYEHRFPA